MIGLRQTLFGPDGTNGVIGQLKGKVSKTALWTALVVIGIPLLVTGIKVWSSNEASEFRFATAQEVHSLKERMSVSETMFKSMCENLADIKGSLVEIKREVNDLIIVPLKRPISHDRMRKMQ